MEQSGVAPVARGIDHPFLHPRFYAAKTTIEKETWEATCSRWPQSDSHRKPLDQEGAKHPTGLHQGRWASTSRVHSSKSLVVHEAISMSLGM